MRAVTVLHAPSRLRRHVVTAGLVALVLAACGGTDDPDPAVTATPPAATGTDTTTGTATDTGTEVAGTGTVTEPSETPTDGEGTPGELAGEPFGMAREGGTYAVVGVAHDDVLNVRAAPGVDAEIVTELPPDGEATATGRDRLLNPGGLWYEVDAAGTIGWVNAGFLGGLGPVTDVTAAVVEANGGELPTAETMEQLGEAVAATRASEEPPSDIVVSVAPSVGDLAEITVDVIGLGDDSVHGERLHVFATPAEGGDGFVLKSVEATALCGRGANSGEPCP